MKKLQNLITENKQFVSKYKDTIEEIKKCIEKTLNDNDENKIKKFITDYNEEDNTNIEGLINNSDIYDFYLKHQSDIDDVLKENNFFTNTPSKDNVYSLYDFVIQGTLYAIDIFMKNM